MRTEQKVPLLHRTGLHLRPAGRVAETANKFQSEIRLTVTGRQVNCKSVLELLTLGAGPGVDLVFAADGPDADKAVEALVALVRNNFDMES